MKLIRVIVAMAIVSNLIACRKDRDKVIITPDPPSESVLQRSLIYTNRNAERADTSYTNKQIKTPLVTTVSLSGDRLGFSFIAFPMVKSSSGESLRLEIDAFHLQNGVVKTYRFRNSSNILKFARYSYAVMDDGGGIWGSIIDTGMGVEFEGSLTITEYDKSRKLINGYFEVKANKLISDPLERSIGKPIDPKDQCDLTLSGEFQNVKVEG